MHPGDALGKWMSYTTNSHLETVVPGEAVRSGDREATFTARKLAMHANQRYMKRRVKITMQEAGEPFKWKAIQVPRGPNPNGWTA